MDFPYYPADEAQHYSYPVGFHGCYGCTGHHCFTVCPTKRELAYYQKFHWNLHCHKPKIFFKNRTGKQSGRENQTRKNVSFERYGPQTNTRQSNVNAPGGQAQGRTAPFGQGHGTNTPSWMGSTNPMYTPSSSIPTPPPLLLRPNDREDDNYVDQVKNFAEEYVPFLDINSMFKIKTRPMPITSRNELSHIELTFFLWTITQ